MLGCIGPVYVICWMLSSVNIVDIGSELMLYVPGEDVQVSVMLETREVLNAEGAHPSRKNSTTITKVLSSFFCHDFLLVSLHVLYHQI